MTLAAEKELKKKTQAGMKSNLEIDYSNPSQVYLDAVAVPGNNHINNVVFVENNEGNMIGEAMAMKNAGSPDKLAWDRIKKRNSYNLHLDD